MPRRLYPCTPTRLSTWLDCPRRYRMAYLDRPAPAKGPPWAHNSFGASVHNALAGWWRLRRPQRTVTAAGDLLEGGWIGEGYAGPGQSAEQRAKARDMVERYTATLDPGAEPLGVERTVGTHTEHIVLSGRIDRLDARRGPAGETRARRGGLQDRAPAADHRRRQDIAGARAVRAGRGADLPCAVPAGWSCTICPPARFTPGSTRRRPWTGTCSGPKVSRPSAATPMSGSAPGCPPGRWTRCSRRARVPAAAGVTSARCARRGPRQARRTGPGTGSAMRGARRAGAG